MGVPHSGWKPEAGRPSPQPEHLPALQRDREGGPWSDGRPRKPESPVQRRPLQHFPEQHQGRAVSVLGATSSDAGTSSPGPPVASRPWHLRPAWPTWGAAQPGAPISASRTSARASGVTPAEETLPGLRPRCPGGAAPGIPARAEEALVFGRRDARGGGRREPEPEPAPLGRRGRRISWRLSERPVPHLRRDGRACSTLSLSGPELKQFQQSALADYIKRKAGSGPRAPAVACRSRGGCWSAPRALSLRARASPRLPVSARFGSPACRPAGRPPFCQPLRWGLWGDQRSLEDRSSSFASGRHLGGRHRETQRRENCSVELTVDQGPPEEQDPRGEPSPWGGATALGGRKVHVGRGSAGERSDVQAVPVHMRSRSSPTRRQAPGTCGVDLSTLPFQSAKRGKLTNPSFPLCFSLVCKRAAFVFMAGCLSQCPYLMRSLQKYKYY